jgi:DNA-binding LacI/PurR family transcriptional regulator
MPVAGRDSVDSASRRLRKPLAQRHSKEFSTNRGQIGVDYAYPRTIVVGGGFMTVSSTPKSSRNRRRICLLLDTAEFAYQNELLLGVHEQCRAADVDVYCLSGGGISAARAGQSLYDLVGPGDYDGIIMSTGTMVHDESTEELHAFLRRFGQTPTVSLSTAVPEIASVIVDNQTSVRELTKHLIETHGKRRIGFVRVNSPEGEQRFEGYQEALFDHGIPLDPALVVVGEFTWESGVRAVRVLFDERKANCDALVGSNDSNNAGSRCRATLR